MTNQERRALKAQGQLLEPIVRIGRGGLSPAVLGSIEQAFKSRELIKIRFDYERPERDELARQVAVRTSSELVMQVGKVGLYFRPKPLTEPAAEPAPKA